MKFNFLFLLPLVALCGCESDGKGPAQPPCPVTGIELPRSDATSPVKPGQMLVIRGSGFAPDCEIWLHAAAKAAGDAGAVKAEITEVTNSSLSFTAPALSGRQVVELRQDGGTWELGELDFPTGEEEQPLETLPRRVSHIRVTYPEDMTFVVRYTYDAEGRITAIRETDKQYTSGQNQTENDDLTTVEYASGRIVETNPDGAVLTYELTDGRTTAITAAQGSHSCPDDCTFSYDAEGNISKSTWAENPGHGYSGKCSYSIVNGSLIRWSDDGTDYTVRNNPERLNNLNIDLFGVDAFAEETPFGHIYLFGAGGNRLRTLPDRIDEDGNDAEIFRYKTEGEYISEIDISDKEGELITRLEIFYE